MNAIFRHDYHLAVEPASTPRPLVQKILERFSTYCYALSAVSVLVVAQSSSEITEGLMNNPVYSYLIPTQFVQFDDLNLYSVSA